MKTLDKVIYLLLMLVFLILGKISFRTGKQLGNILGGIWFALDKKHRKTTLDNLSLAYKNEKNITQISDLARKVFNNTVRMIFEYAWFYNSVSKLDSDHIRVNGLDHLKDAHVKGKGVLILSAHMGNWEIGALLAPISGLPISIVYRKIKSEPIDRIVRQNRERLGMSLYPLHNALEGVNKTLKNGNIVGLLMDQNTGLNRGVFVDFFNMKACANPGLAKLALQSGAPVIPVYCYREHSKFIIEIQAELPIIRSGNIEQDILLNTQIQNTAIEKIVKQHPDQWFWIHKRWKTRPLEEQ